MALNAHVAGRVVRVIPIETDREITLVLVYALLSHKIHALLVDECAVVDVESLVTNFHKNTDLHRNEIEYPCSVSHLLREVTMLFHV